MAILISRMLAKRATDRPLLHKIIHELEVQEKDSIIRTHLSAEGKLILRKSSYRWNFHVHQRLGNSLHYVFVKAAASSPDHDITWLKNTFSECGINGFSIYRVLGGFDYLIRVWLKDLYLEVLNDVLGRFRTTHGGVVRSFRPRSFKLSWKGKPIKQHDRDALLKDICDCASNDAASEYAVLREKHFVVSRLDQHKNRSIRFFVTLSSAEKVEDFILGACADKFGKSLDETVAANPKEISVYTGEGDFLMLLKFRLEHFFEFRDIVQSLLNVAATMVGYHFAFQTYIEMDPDGFIESDDGSILHEATEYFRHHG